VQSAKLQVILIRCFRFIVLNYTPTHMHRDKVYYVVSADEYNLADCVVHYHTSHYSATYYNYRLTKSKGALHELNQMVNLID